MDRLSVPSFNFDFKSSSPKETGVYYLIETSEYDDFKRDSSSARLDSLREVFVKKDEQGFLYAVGKDIRLEEEDFFNFVWAKYCDFS